MDCLPLHHLGFSTQNLPLRCTFVYWTSYWTFPLGYLVVPLRLMSTRGKILLHAQYTSVKNNKKSYWNHYESRRADSIIQIFVTSKGIFHLGQTWAKTLPFMNFPDEVKENRCPQTNGPLFPIWQKDLLCNKAKYHSNFLPWWKFGVYQSLNECLSPLARVDLDSLSISLAYQYAIHNYDYNNIIKVLLYILVSN